MSKKILYFECYSGISGDMTVASLLDLGADRQVLMDALESLNIGGFKIEIGRTKKCGIDACSFDVILDDEKEKHNHGHSHEYAHEHNHSHNHNDDHDHEHEHEHEHGHEHDHAHDHEHNHDHNHDHEHSHDHIHDHNHEHSHDHNHDHEHSHDHEHTHEHGHEHAHEHNHRNINDIYKIIDESKISEKAKSIAKKIFHVVAMAEAKAHGVAMEEVHFHEVGAVDSIVDIVATAVCIDNLKVNDIVVSELYEGTGHVRCQHGIIPVPVPAVVNIVSDHALKIRITDAQGEMITPTGAAIVAALKTQDELPKVCRIEKVGIGAGKKDFKRANILRAFLIETEVSEKTCNCEQTSEGDSVWVLETNIDDSTGENLGYVMNKLFEAGARDVFFTPIYMKKNRPAYKMTVICSEEKFKAMEDLIFKNTSSIGIRRYKAERTILAREIIEVGTKYGKVKVKLCYHGSEKYYYPEYGDVESICNRTGKSFKQVYEEIKMSCIGKL